MAPTPEADDHDSGHSTAAGQSQTASQPRESASPASPAQPSKSTTALSPRQAHPAPPPPPGPYPYPPYPGAHPFFGPPGYPYDPNMPPPPNPDGSYPPHMMYGYPPPPGGGQHPGGPGQPPMGMFWHPQWGPPPGFEGRWMMPPPMPGQEGMSYEQMSLRRGDGPLAKRRKTGDTEGDDGERKAKKKIEVACSFCRERKLRCDGARPQCGNCSLRERDCFYQPGPPNRRGPGKKSKSAAQAQLSVSQHQQSLVPAAALANLAAMSSGLPPMPSAGPSEHTSPMKPLNIRMENPKKKKGE